MKLSFQLVQYENADTPSPSLKRGRKKEVDLIATPKIVLEATTPGSVKRRGRPAKHNIEINASTSVDSPRVKSKPQEAVVSELIIAQQEVVSENVATVEATQEIVSTEKANIQSEIVHEESMPADVFEKVIEVEEEMNVQDNEKDQSENIVTDASETVVQTSVTPSVETPLRPLVNLTAAKSVIQLVQEENADTPGPSLKRGRKREVDLIATPKLVSEVATPGSAKRRGRPAQNKIEINATISAFNSPMVKNNHHDALSEVAVVQETLPQ